jgi:hypothetical protein
MSIIEIKDGTGSGQKVKVKDFRLDTSARTNPRSYYVSRDTKQVYNATSDVPSAAAGDYVLYIKNTSSTKNLFVGGIEYHSTQAVQWRVWKVTGTPGGASDIGSRNLNLGSANIAEADIYGDLAVTGLTIDGRPIGVHRTDTNGEAGMEFGDALILTPQTAIAVEYHAGTTGQCEIDCFFYFEDIID